jgi:hypothetical protein
VTVNYNVWTSLRMRLICWLAGDMQILINANIHKGNLYIREDHLLVWNTTLIENRIMCETPELQRMFFDVLGKVQKAKGPTISG